ncbi:hypothetical protein EC991_010359, partial [Linnemannia zychae]
QLATMICGFVAMDREHWGAIILDLNSHIIYFGSSSQNPISLRHLEDLLFYINPLSASQDRWTAAMKDIKPLSSNTLPQLPDLGALAIAMEMEQRCNTHLNWSRDISENIDDKGDKDVFGDDGVAKVEWKENSEDENEFDYGGSR